MVVGLGTGAVICPCVDRHETLATFLRPERGTKCALPAGIHPPALHVAAEYFGDGEPRLMSYNIDLFVVAEFVL
jgi:hypothetical protein